MTVLTAGSRVYSSRHGFPSLATRARFGPESRWLPLSTLTPTDCMTLGVWKPRQGQQVIIRNGKSVSGIGIGVAHWQKLRLPQPYRE